MKNLIIYKKIKKAKKCSKKVLTTNRCSAIMTITNIHLVIFGGMVMIRRRRLRRLKRLKRRRFITKVMLLITLLMTVSTMANFAFAKKSDADFLTVIVKNGESVWTIAKENNPNNMDLRRLVYEIIEENDIENGVIYAGDELVIPLS